MTKLRIWEPKQPQKGEVNYRYVFVREYASAKGISVSTVYRWLTKGTLTAMKLAPNMPLVIAQEADNDPA